MDTVTATALDYRNTFNTAAGKRVFADLVKNFDPASDCFTPGGGDGLSRAIDAAKRDGAKTPVRHIINRVKAGDGEMVKPGGEKKKARMRHAPEKETRDDID